MLQHRLAEQFQHTHGHSPGRSEQRSWDRSLRVLAQDLADAGLHDVEVLVEYRLPLSSKRIDAILAGEHPRTGKPSFVVVELKQWSSAEVVDGAEDLCVVDGLGQRPRLHPVEQVRRYCSYLADFNRALAPSAAALSGVAYLHNATDRTVQSLSELPESELGRLYTGQRRDALVTHFRSRLAPRPGSASADFLLSGAIAPSKQLMSVAADEIKNREQFVLLDEQQVAYSLVLNAVRKARRSNHKEVVVVLGGPGSGKSVIALSLLGELSRQGRVALHATGSRSFTMTMRKIAGDRAPRVKALFKYFHDFALAEPNGLDVLICDEAHRIREVSANRFTPAKHRTGRPQVEELIDAARVPVFLLDENQVVRPGEMGSLAEIGNAALRMGLPVRLVNLEAQFRCGGSDRYLEWVHRLLGLAPGGPTEWTGDEMFQLRLAESPAAMEAFLRRRLAEGLGARIAAGFCWPWHEPNRDGSLVDDVVIDAWRRPWNVKGDRAAGGAPPAALWSTDPAGFSQVGCIYTAQGFEYDWSGVILGPDLVWRDAGWVADSTASHDPMRRQAEGAEFDALVRNVYKVLLTRGMQGSILYSTDPRTQKLLRSLIPSR